MKDICRLFFDIDGTLIDPKGQIDTEIIYHLNNANHLRIGIATARDYPGSVSIFKRFTHQDVLIIENGAVICDGGKYHLLSDIRSLLIELAHRLKSLPVTLNFGNKLENGRINSMAIKLNRLVAAEQVINLCDDYIEYLEVIHTDNKIYLYPKNLDKSVALSYVSDESVYYVSDGEKQFAGSPLVHVICVRKKWHPTALMYYEKVCNLLIDAVRKHFLRIRSSRKSNFTESYYDDKRFIRGWLSATMEPQGDIRQVAAYVFNNEKILLVHTSKGWQLPGGKIEKNENMMSALNRELMEEANCLVRDVKLFGYHKVFAQGESIPFLQLRCHCELSALLQQELTFETDKIAWVELNNISHYLPWFSDRNYQDELAALISNRRT